jgi:DNA-binding MarR family transcriptional regulator
MHERRAKENTANYPVASQVKRVLQLFRDSLDEKLRPYGVTAAQLHVLAALEREPGISGARLARTCMVTPQTTQVAIRTIEANGWIRRAKHPENERILLATLTPSGKRLLTRSRTAIGRLYATMLEGFAAKDVLALETLLSRCAANLESQRTSTSQLR